MYTMKEIPIQERPRERAKEVGVENLTDHELLSILLKTGTKEKNVSELSMEILKKVELQDLKETNLLELKNIKGIGEVKLLELQASIELGKRIYLRKPKEYVTMDNPKSIWEDARYFLTDLKQEQFYGYYFNTKQQLIKRKRIFIGTINQASTHTREIFKEAYQVSASYIVCIHNHPSNDVTPSKSDIIFTNHLMETGEIQGIPVVDHIIVGEQTFYSFHDHKNSL